MVRTGSSRGDEMTADPRARAERLSCWRGAVEATPLGGGMTNTNFVVHDGGEKFVVRIGDDIPIHQVMRFNERAASIAAHAAGLSPEVVHSEAGALVMRFVEGRTLTPEEVRRPEMLPRVVELVRRCHRELPKHLRGPALVFWPFHVLRDYAATLEEGRSRWAPELPRFRTLIERFEAELGPTEIVFGHNDLLPSNLIDDGERLWLIDWDYAGFSTPLFDLANLATNGGFEPEQEDALLRLYFGAAPDPRLKAAFSAMRCTSLLREVMWSMVAEIHSTLEFDYPGYTAEQLARFEVALALLEETGD
jgi:thiamine kinase-like enzyme